MALSPVVSRVIDEEAASLKRDGANFARPYDPNNPSPDLFSKWVYESQLESSDWRQESWTDQEFFDGRQWSEFDYQKAINGGIEPITVNQIFATVSLVLGSQTQSKLDIMAKGRTHKDNEIQMIMTEGIKYVMDQWDGEYKISEAFKQQCIPGFGCLAVTYDSDPRKEIVKIGQRDWKEMGWDPYASPWFDPKECRYVYHSKWVDLSNLVAMYPEKKEEILFQFSDSRSNVSITPREDAADLVEWQHRINASGFIDTSRKRGRPVEMWYPINVPCFFARYPDGSIAEIPDDMSIDEQYRMIMQSAEIIQAVVQKMRLCTFLGNETLIEMASPFAHDDYPFVPFVGYLDRFMHPYGVPRQVRDMQIETNKRRSMALRLLNSRRVTVESDVVEEGGLQNLYDEANKPDGFLVVRPGALRDKKIVIEEQAQLAPTQMNMMAQSEAEIQRVSGINASMMGQQSGANESGKLADQRERQGTIITSVLFDNLRRSMKKLGEQVVSAIQHKWTGEKVLRITDRMSGAERFVEINKKAQNQFGAYEVKNDMTQGRYDVIISEVPIQDTIREQNLQLLIEWAKKSPPEIIPFIMSAALELSNIPNKEKLLAQIRPILGVPDESEEMTVDQLKEQQKQQALQKQQANEMMQKLQQELTTAELEELRANIEKVQAETERIRGNVALDPLRAQKEMAKMAAETRKTENDSARVEIEGFKAGADTTHKNERLKMEQRNQTVDHMHRIDDRDVKIEQEKAANAQQIAERQQRWEEKQADNAIKEMQINSPPAEKTVGRSAPAKSAGKK